MLNCALHFSCDAELVAESGVHTHPDDCETFAAINVHEAGRRGVHLYFGRVDQIETLVAALQDLGNKLAAALPLVKTDADGFILPPEAGECRGCKRAIAAGGDLCEECELIVAKVAW